MPRLRLLMTNPTWVYKLRCVHGGLLYVGITSDLDTRIRQHRREKPWWDEVDSAVAWQMPSRRRAREAELWAIEHEMPQYNLEGVNDYDQWLSNRWRDIVGRENRTHVRWRDRGDF